MSITLELPAEVEKRFAALVETHGTPEAAVAYLIESDGSSMPSSAETSTPPERSIEDRFAGLDRITALATDCGSPHPQTKEEIDDAMAELRSIARPCGTDVRTDRASFYPETER